MATKKVSQKRSKKQIREEVLQIAVKAGQDEEAVRAILFPKKKVGKKEKKQSRTEGLKRLKNIKGVKVSQRGKNGATKVAKFFIGKEKRLVWHPGQAYPEALIQEGAVGASYAKVTVEQAEKLLSGKAKARLVVK